MSTFTQIQFPSLTDDNFNHEIVQTPKLIPGEGQIVIKNKAVAINPLDAKRLVYGIRIESWPTGGGFEVAGVVDSVGDGVTDLKVGDEVMAVVGPSELSTYGFQEYSRIQAGGAVRKPKNLSFEEAASLPITTVTATGVLSFGLGTPFPFFSQSGAAVSGIRTVLVLGGSSGVGAQAIQLLHHYSPEITILATASTQNFDLVKSLGASHVFNYHDADVLKQIQKAAPEGVNAIVDFVGSLVQDTQFYKLYEGTQKPKVLATLATGPPIDKEGLPKDVEVKEDLGLVNVIMKGGVTATLQAVADEVEKGEFKLPVPVNVLGKGFDKIIGGLKISFKGASAQKLVVSL